MPSFPTLPRTLPCRASSRRTLLPLTLACTAALVASACAPRMGSSFSRAFDPAKYDNIAVGEFAVSEVGSDRQEEARRVATRAFEKNLVKMNYRIVERQRLQELLEEQGRQWGELTTEERRAQVGKLLNAEALLLGEVYRYRENEETGQNEVVISAELVDVETGEVLWSDEGAVGVERSTSTGDMDEVITQLSQRTAESRQEEGDDAPTVDLSVTASRIVRNMSRRLPMASYSETASDSTS